MRPTLAHTSKEDFEITLKAHAEHHNALKSSLDLARWRLIGSIRDAARVGVSEQRIVELSGLKPERIHQIVKSFSDPRSVRV